MRDPIYELFEKRVMESFDAIFGQARGGGGKGDKQLEAELRADFDDTVADMGLSQPRDGTSGQSGIVRQGGQGG